MALDFNSVERPFRKLRKSLKGFSESPMPEDVHALRTKTRRVEAIVQPSNSSESQSVAISSNVWHRFERRREMYAIWMYW
jgi:hypothetical protein